MLTLKLSHLKPRHLLCREGGDDGDSQGDGSSQPDTISIASRTSQNTVDSDKVGNTQAHAHKEELLNLCVKGKRVEAADHQLCGCDELMTRSCFNPTGSPLQLQWADAGAEGPCLRPFRRCMCASCKQN